MRAGHLLLLAVGFLLLTASLHAETVGSVPNPRERDGTWVTDQVGVLDAKDRALLDGLLDDLEAGNGTELAVAVIDRTDGRSPKDFATDLFNRWGIGKAGVDNGVLFLVVMGARRIEVEVGDGARRHVSDGRVADILARHVVPAFKAGKPSAGIVAGVVNLVNALKGVDYSTEPRGPMEAPSGEPRDERPLLERARDWVYGILVAIFLPCILLVRSWLRNRQRYCQHCTTGMQRLDETADDAHLDDGQRLEERLGSIDYDVWVCPACYENLVIPYASWFSSYSRCRSCNRCTCEVTSKTEVWPTYSSSGRGRRYYHCKYCDWRHTETYTIPRKQKSSSSSSSSSSFGGGRSYGGGAGASW